MVALIVALPWVFYQVWAFVAPGLYAHEKRLVLPLVISSSLLFIGGVAFCYFFVFGRVFHFIAEFAPASIAVMPDIENYLDFVMSMCLAFGATFEVPVVVIILVRMGIVSLKKLREVRPYLYVGAFIVAAIVTPPDVVSQLALAIPMCLLFELGLLLFQLQQARGADRIVRGGLDAHATGDLLLGLGNIGVTLLITGDVGVEDLRSGDARTHSVMPQKLLIRVSNVVRAT